MHSLQPERWNVTAVIFLQKEIAEGALNIAADICVFTNHNIIVEEFKEGWSYDKSKYITKRNRQKLDQYIVGQTSAKKSVAVALRNRYRRSSWMENAARCDAERIF